jgi:very-short-patch-repair endonuclease
MAAHLVIEVGGSQHGRAENVMRDETRTRWLKTAGYRVIRFWNNDLFTNMDGVLERIYETFYGSLRSEAAPFRHWRRQRNDAQQKERG